MDPSTRTCKCWMTNKNISTTALYGHRVDLLEAMNDTNEWRARFRKIRDSRVTWWWYMYTIRTFTMIQCLIGRVSFTNLLSLFEHIFLIFFVLQFLFTKLDAHGLNFQWTLSTWSTYINCLPTLTEVMIYKTTPVTPNVYYTLNSTVLFDVWYLIFFFFFFSFHAKISLSNLNIAVFHTQWVHVGLQRNWSCRIHKFRF